jgi:hypothetical protein|tara:strand:+ start:913 stop:1089 length:177 start_codon:yes stop_codon:yes gene_type:complete
MKIGDIVQWASLPPKGKENDIGIIIGFDEDGDPIVVWDIGPIPQLGEFKSQLEVLNNV